MKFPVKSATYAMLGKQLLSQKGIHASVGKSSDSSGCYYYLKVSDRHEEFAKKLLNDHNVLKA